MCFERTVGCILLALVFAGYMISRVIRNVNWALHMHYFRKWLRIQLNKEADYD
jgi:hypothetical protein